MIYQVQHGGSKFIHRRMRDEAYLVLCRVEERAVLGVGATTRSAVHEYHYGIVNGVHKRGRGLTICMQRNTPGLPSLLPLSS